MEFKDCVLDDHSRTIVHIDIDCFYAQVEMIKNPDLKSVPIGVRQKACVVTSNYIAREQGIKKCMKVSDAKKLCPNIILVNGEDLHDYRQISYKITALLQNYSTLVERLGLDENFIDVSTLVSKKQGSNGVKVVGNVFGESTNLCDCGCTERLNIGTHIAQELRDRIRHELDLTSSAGIGHNKLLAKLAGNLHKPNQQTVIYPNSAVELMLTLPKASKIPGVGVTLEEQLGNISIKTVEDLQNTRLSKLANILGPEKATFIYNSSYGVDKTLVKPSGKPQSIGIEDSCMTYAIEEVKNKLRQLLNRLLILVGEDGRMPRTIKLTVRKFDKNNKFTNRESRQCNINAVMFSSKDITNLSEANMNKIMAIIMRLFDKLVDTKKPYHLTLLGLSFTKFLDRPSNTGLKKFLIKDIEVQSITNIESSSVSEIVPGEIPSTSHEDKCDIDVEPLIKKFKFSNIPIAQVSKESTDCASPCKLRVADLRLNSTEARDSHTDSNQNINCPPSADENVFRELPKDVQQELWNDYKRSRDRDKAHNPAKKSKPNVILNYFVKR